MVKVKKIIVFKMKAKKNYRRKQGHRQPYTKVEITTIKKSNKKKQKLKQKQKKKKQKKIKSKTQKVIYLKENYKKNQEPKGVRYNGS